MRLGAGAGGVGQALQHGCKGGRVMGGICQVLQTGGWAAAVDVSRWLAEVAGRLPPVGACHSAGCKGWLLASPQVLSRPAAATTGAGLLLPGPRCWAPGLELVGTAGRLGAPTARWAVAAQGRAPTGVQGSGGSGGSRVAAVAAVAPGSAGVLLTL